MKSWKHIMMAGLCLAGSTTAPAESATSYDESVQLGLSYQSSGNTTVFAGFRAINTTDPLMAALAIRTPTFFLEVGTRYRIVNTHAPTHEFSLVADGSGVDDVVLLAQGSTVGTAENLPSVNWHDAGTIVYFTFSEELLALLSASGRVPTYRSTPSGLGLIHPRGTVSSGFSWTNNPVPQLETFESGNIDQHIFSARNDWFVSSSSPVGLYTARIGNLPVGAIGQAPGSTRWLRIVDAYQPQNDTLNSVVTAGIVAPPSTVGVQYTWEFLLNVEAKQSNTNAYVGVEHFNQASGGYERAWGLWITANQVFMGLNDDVVSSEANGSTLGAPLYQFTQAGFGTNQWLRVVLSADFENSSFTATVHPSNGGSPVTATIDPPGEAFVSTILDGNFRFAIDNTASANNSTLCIDNLALQTAGHVMLSVDHWELYR